MATVVRNQMVKRFGEPMSHGRRAAPARRSAVKATLHWVATHPGVTSIGLSAIYLVTLGALVAVLNASALATPFGAVVGVLFILEVLVYFGIAGYIVTPERS